ncbi:MAG TPA: glycosyltransferase [Bryobacteraceae bacterium]|nr:glycosyltransferase [Bryobacteraceae bacterium]
MSAPPLEIAFFGSSLISAWWNGAATYYRGLIRALANRGHAITFYEPDAYDRRDHRDIDDPDWAKSVIFQAQTESDVDAALRCARNADLIVKCSGVGVWDEYLEAGVLRIRKPSARVAFLDVDAPATLDRVHSNPRDPFLELIPLYDFIFTYGGGDPVVNAYRELGARECVPIYNALDPETHHPVAPDPRFHCDLGFLGNRLPDREARVEEFFLRPATLCNASFLLGGNGWQDKPLPANVRWAGHVYTADHNAFNCSAKSVLNIARDSMARYGFSPATRVFEAAGAGACIITDAWTGIELFLQPGEEILVAENGADVARLLTELSAERARTIGHAAKKRILASHTYAHRAALLEDVLSQARTAGAAR